MARVKREQPLVSSVLDRLIDERPDVEREPAKSQNQVLAELRESVRRDLENLLNTPCHHVSWPVELTELDRSLVGYGIPEASAANLGSAADREKFLRKIERIIRTFEPRFKSVRVEGLQNADLFDRTLRFRIDAMLHAYPAPEPIIFDSQLEPATGNFQIQGKSA